MEWEGFIDILCTVIDVDIRYITYDSLKLSADCSITNNGYNKVSSFVPWNLLQASLIMIKWLCYLKFLMSDSIFRNVVT